MVVGKWVQRFVYTEDCVVDALWLEANAMFKLV